MTDRSKELFRIPLPGGRVARVPFGVLEQYVDPEARACHGAEPPPAEQSAGSHPTTTIRTEDGMITINIYSGRGEVRVEQHEAGGEQDVTAHHLAVDPTTGTSDWHTDWEQGQCEYTDENGMPQAAYLWHRHPFGTEYTEIFEG